MKSSPNHPLRTLTAGTLMCACALVGASAFHIDLQPVFFSSHHAMGTQPISVDLENDGPDAKGVLHVMSSSFSMDYPVELPRGSHKRLITYPTTDSFEITTLLDTDQGRLTKSFPLIQDIDANTATILLIGDDPGALTFLSGGTSQIRANGGAPGTFNGAPTPVGSGMVVDAYCSPSDAPPRAVGYSPIRAVVLGPGAERMSDSSVEALKTWAIEGGSLVFLGGASSPVISDARWQSVLPATRFSPKTVLASDTLASLGSAELSGPITLLEPQDLHGAAVRADGETIITAESGFGIGRVIYLAFNPLEAPLNRWEGRTRAMSSILSPGMLGNPEQILSQLGDGAIDLHPGSAMAMSADTSDAATAGSIAPMGTSLSASDPFNTKLPPPGQVFGVLAGYFLAVVPLNFLILKKLKRGELAWYTAPILSLGFASILFKSADTLYSQKMSTASQGVVLVRDGAPQGVFVGSTEMFIPKGGRYDLGMTGIDNIITINDVTNDFTKRSSASTMELNPVDNGAISVPNMLASNLAFREISYHQLIQTGDKYSIKLHREGGMAVCELRNGSASKLTSTMVYVGKHQLLVGDLDAGQTKVVKLNLTDPPVQISNSVESALAFNGGAAFQARLSNFRPGPQIGEEVAERTQISLLVFSKDALGGIR